MDNNEKPTPPTPTAIPAGMVDNFKTLLLASQNDDLMLVSAVRISDYTPAVLVCAASRTENDDEIAIVPFAEMCTGNPYEEFYIESYNEKEKT